MINPEEKIDELLEIRHRISQMPYFKNKSSHLKIIDETIVIYDRIIAYEKDLHKAWEHLSSANRECSCADGFMGIYYLARMHYNIKLSLYSKEEARKYIESLEKHTGLGSRPDYSNAIKPHINTIKEHILNFTEPTLEDFLYFST